MVHVTHHHKTRPPGQARRWPDWANMALGVLIAASPWLVGYVGLGGATMNAIIIGFLVFALSALALTLLDRWEAYINALLGVWLLLSPWLLGFAIFDMAKFAHLFGGALVLAIAFLEIWQGGAAAEA